MAETTTNNGRGVTPTQNPQQPSPASHQFATERNMQDVPAAIGIPLFTAHAPARVVSELTWSLCRTEGIKIQNGVPDKAVETSTIIPVAPKMYLAASDKPIPGTSSPVVAVLVDNHGRAVHTVPINSASLNSAAKIESSTVVTLDGTAFALFATGFDRRASSEHPDWDKYRRVMISPLLSPECSDVILGTHNPKFGARAELGSLAIGEALSRSLNSPYFKIEGMTAVPSSNPLQANIIFGVREIGSDFAHANQVFKFINARLTRNGTQFVIDQVSEPMDFPINQVSHGLQRANNTLFDQGLSSLEYDKDNNRLIALSSVEIAPVAGEARNYPVHRTYFWSIKLEGGRPVGPIEQFCDASGGPLVLDTKGEGLAVVPGSHGTRWIVIADSDREIWNAGERGQKLGNGPNEARTTIVELPAKALQQPIAQGGNILESRPTNSRF